MTDDLASRIQKAHREDKDEESKKKKADNEKRNAFGQDYGLGILVK